MRKTIPRPVASQLSGQPWLAWNRRHTRALKAHDPPSFSMKRKLDLRTGRPVWSAYRAPHVPTDSLSRDAKADVLIIGMGVSGAMVAQAMAADGLSVVVIDRRGPLKGSTAATTALVSYELDQPLSLLAEKIGKDKAERTWRRSRLALAGLKARIAELAIPCRLAERPSIYLSGNVLDAGKLRREGEARRAAGLHATWLDRAELRARFGIERAAALISPDNLALDPKKLAAGLLRDAASRGAKLYAPAEAARFELSGSRVLVGTEAGPVIDAAAVVLATGYELADIVPAVPHRIISTWAIATKPQPRRLWPQEAFIWEASDPYLYIRATSDGRIICGGEDEPFGDEERRDALIGDKTAAIAAKLGKLLPGIDATPDFAWAGSFGTTATGMPIIGRLPRRGPIYAVMGYGGNGITFSALAAEIVRTALAGGKDRDADLFALA